MEGKSQNEVNATKFLNNIDNVSELVKTVIQLSEEELNSGNNPAFNKFLALYRDDCDFKKLTRTVSLELIASLTGLYIINRSPNCTNTFDKVSALLSAFKTIVDLRKALQIYNSNDEKDLGDVRLQIYNSNDEKDLGDVRDSHWIATNKKWIII
jgi:hypothetical protein